MIAALYVESGGCYYGLPDVDPWDEQRDARQYRGPHPVVAHPPCARWGRYWHGGPNSEHSPRERQRLGDDGGCFAHALWAVRTFGGVIEHPEASSAWRWFGLNPPPRRGGWVPADSFGGWTCCVEQGHYGHRARKATWLYAVKTALPLLVWGPSQSSVRLEDGFHSAEERAAAKTASVPNAPRQRQRPCERAVTPLPFRDLLLSLVRSVSEPPDKRASDGVQQLLVITEELK